MEKGDIELLLKTAVSRIAIQAQLESINVTTRNTKRGGSYPVGLQIKHVIGVGIQDILDVTLTLTQLTLTQPKEKPVRSVEELTILP